MRRMPVLLIPAAFVAVLWFRAAPAHIGTAAEAAARSLEARSAKVTITMTAAGAPAFRATGRVTMSPPETRLRSAGAEVIVAGGGARVRAESLEEWITMPVSGLTPFDDVGALLQLIEAGTIRGVTVDIDDEGRVARIIATARDGQVTIRLGPYTG